MRHIFVFTAGNSEARDHLRESITHAVPFSRMEEAIGSQDTANFKALTNRDDGFYAWGAVPGPRNEQTWAAMRVGDIVLTVYGNRYKFLSTVAGKLRNKELASRIWGVDESGHTWEFMYLLTEPQALDVGVLDEPVASELNRGYRGFCRISDEKVQAILQKYGSLDHFIANAFQGSLPSTALERELEHARAEAFGSDRFDPSSIADGRKKVIREVVQRQGQPKFREDLMAAYEGKCAVTGCDIAEVLEAAHIAPYFGKDSNVVQNGLLLRADIHTLFDLGQLKITPEGRVELHERLFDSVYAQYESQLIRRPSLENQRPSKDALTWKYTLVL
jgi:hypothetical protein